ncbi:MAG: lytic transglycosylase domain-containing protein [Kiritimatiellia bacterium]
MKRKSSITSGLLLGAALLLPLGVTAFRPRPDAVGLDRFPAAPAPLEASAAARDAEQNAARLVDAIIQIESNGDARKVGRHGERGLMQIRAGTWRDMTTRLFGHPRPFDQAFDPALNRRVGIAYLAFLQESILPRQAEWQADERSLLLAAYNAGPGRLRRSGFDLARMPSQTQDYVERAGALHDAYLGDLAAVRIAPRPAAAL